MSNSQILYFAYGSNLSLARLSARVPSARPVCTANLHGYRFALNLLSGDQSGKANIVPVTSASSASVQGVLFTISKDQLRALDAAEGLGFYYQRNLVQVEDKNGNLHQAWTYVGLEPVLREGLRAYNWYLNFITFGAREHRMDPAWIEYLEALPQMTDPDKDRFERNNRILQVLPNTSPLES